MRYNYTEIGARIRDNRKRIGKNQEGLLELLKKYDVSMSRNTLSDIENGVPKQTIGLDLLDALCEIFDCDIGYLLCEYDERHRVTADVCAITGLSEWAAQFLCDCKEASDIYPDERAEKLSHLGMISNLLEEEAAGSDFIRDAREYILIRFDVDDVPANIQFEDSDGYTINYTTTTSGLIDLTRQRAIERYGKTLDAIRQHGQKQWAKYREENK